MIVVQVFPCFFNMCCELIGCVHCESVQIGHREKREDTRQDKHGSEKHHVR